MYCLVKRSGEKKIEDGENDQVPSLKLLSANLTNRGDNKVKTE